MERESKMKKQKSILLILLSIVLLSGCMSFRDAVEEEKKWENENPIYSNLKTASGDITPGGGILVALLGVGAAMAFGKKKGKKI